MFGENQIIPNVSFPMVDVRDVAHAHIESTFSSKFLTRNDRLLISAETMWYKDIV